MQSQLQVHDHGRGFVPTPHTERPEPQAPFLLAPQPGNRPFGWLQRIDWVAVSAAGFVYAVAFVAWLYLAR
jgi:hypothetical protein